VFPVEVTVEVIGGRAYDPDKGADSIWSNYWSEWTIQTHVGGSFEYNKANERTIILLNPDWTDLGDSIKSSSSKFLERGEFRETQSNKPGSYIWVQIRDWSATPQMELKPVQFEACSSDFITLKVQSGVGAGDDVANYYIDKIENHIKEKVYNTPQKYTFDKIKDYLTDNKLKEWNLFIKSLETSAWIGQNVPTIIFGNNADYGGSVRYFGPLPPDTSQDVWVKSFTPKGISVIRFNVTVTESDSTKTCEALPVEEGKKSRGGAKQQGIDFPDGQYLPPIKQIKAGISPQEIQCNEGKQLIFKSSDGSPKCVSSVAAEKLVARGWATQ